MGDRKSPKERVVGPTSIHGLFTAYKRADPNHLVTRMILQGDL